MAKNYGIAFCQKGIQTLEAAEDRLFSEKGHGFDRFSKEYLQLLTYQRLLKKFTAEKVAGLQPSYCTEIHGSFNE